MSGLERVPNYSRCLTIGYAWELTLYKSIRGLCTGLINSFVNGQSGDVHVLPDRSGEAVRVEMEAGIVAYAAK